MAEHNADQNRSYTRLTAFIVGGVSLAALLFIFFSGTFSDRTTLPPTIAGNMQTPVDTPHKN